MKASLQEDGLKYTLFGVSVLALGVAADAAPARSATDAAPAARVGRSLLFMEGPPILPPNPPYYSRNPLRCAVRTVKLL